MIGKKQQEIQILKDNVKQLQEALSKTHIKIQEKVDMMRSLKLLEFKRELNKQRSLRLK